MADFINADITKLTFPELIQAMGEATATRQYWDSQGDGQGEYGFRQQAAWKKRVAEIRQRIDELWSSRREMP